MSQPARKRNIDAPVPSWYRKSVETVEHYDDWERWTIRVESLEELLKYGKLPLMLAVTLDQAFQRGAFAAVNPTPIVVPCATCVSFTCGCEKRYGVMARVVLDGVDDLEFVRHAIFASCAGASGTDLIPDSIKKCRSINVWMDRVSSTA